MIKWKTLCNKSCRYCYIESITVEFVFFRFFYDFISILQVHCLMHPGRQDLNVNFFTFRACRQLDGRQAPIFKNFPIRHIFLKSCFFKYKNKKRQKLTMRISGLGPLRAHSVCAPCWPSQNLSVLKTWMVPNFIQNNVGVWFVTVRWNVFDLQPCLNLEKYSQIRCYSVYIAKNNSANKSWIWCTI